MLSNLLSQIDTKQLNIASRHCATTSQGRVTQINGTLIQAEIPAVSMYALCEIEKIGGETLACQVVGFHGSKVHLAPLGGLDGIKPNAKVSCSGTDFSCSIPNNPLGLVVDALGKIIGNADIGQSTGPRIKLNLRQKAPCPLERTPIKKLLHSGVKAIDYLFPLGQGQRIAVIASPGSGKSTLMGMLAKNSNADVIVVGLIGERGREVRHFLDEILGQEGRRRSVVVVATSDQPPLFRQLAANSATAIAEYYREQGKNVLLIIDSITRYARALREVSLAAGELPIRQGFTPSVFTELPILIERAGNSAKGSITALYTVLAQNDMQNDVLSEELSSLTDGHLYLSPKMIQNGIRPAIDPCHSLSRLTSELLSAEQIHKISYIQKLFAALENEKDLLALGGSPSKIMAQAMQLEPQLYNLIKQLPDEVYDAQKLNAEFNTICGLAGQDNCKN